jgi:hypothetical protein
MGSASWRLCTGWAGAAWASGTYGNATKYGDWPPSLVPSAYGLHLARWDCRRLQQVVVEQAVVGAMASTTVARIVAAANLQPHWSRYWKTATIDERFTTKAARILWRYEASARRVPTQLTRRGQIERREYEYKRHGTVTFLAAWNVYDGTMWGCCLEANDHEHFLKALSRLVRCYPCARRLHLILDDGPSPITQATKAYLGSHPRLRAFYTPPHASWRNHAELLLRACSDKYLKGDQQWRKSVIYASVVRYPFPLKQGPKVSPSISGAEDILVHGADSTCDNGPSIVCCRIAFACLHTWQHTFAR